MSFRSSLSLSIFAEQNLTLYHLLRDQQVPLPRRDRNLLPILQDPLFTHLPLPPIRISRLRRFLSLGLLPSSTRISPLRSARCPEGGSSLLQLVQPTLLAQPRKPFALLHQLLRDWLPSLQLGTIPLFVLPSLFLLSLPLPINRSRLLRCLPRNGHPHLRRSSSLQSHRPFLSQRRRSHYLTSLLEVPRPHRTHRQPPRRRSPALQEGSQSDAFFEVQRLLLLAEPSELERPELRGGNHLRRE